MLRGPEPDYRPKVVRGEIVVGGSIRYPAAAGR
jgi:hypothetical protein